MPQISPRIKPESTIPDKLDQNTINLRKLWYSRVFVAMEICKYSKNREMCFLPLVTNYRHRIRYINAGSVNFFFKHIGIPTHKEIMSGEKAQDPFHFFDNNFSIYCSLAHIDWSKSDIKAFSYASRTRKEQQELFKENIDELLYDFDFFADFDGDIDGFEGNTAKKIDVTQEEAVMRALTDLKKLIKFIEQFKLDWWCQPSGGRGWHIFWSIPLDISVKEKLEIANKLKDELADTLNLKTLDKYPYGLRKVAKCAYGLTTKFNKTYVSLPMSDSDLEDFRLENIEVNNVLRNVKLKNRGLFVRNQNVNKEQSIDNFMRLLKDLEVEIGR